MAYIITLKLLTVLEDLHFHALHPQILGLFFHFRTTVYKKMKNVFFSE